MELCRDAERRNRHMSKHPWEHGRDGENMILKKKKKKRKEITYKEPKGQI
jgi:hypothetical protein